MNHPHNNITGTIMPKNSDLPDSIDGKPDSGWQPSDLIIKTAEPIIIQYIKDSDHNIYSNLDKYGCQYIGIRIKGEDRIYCNFFYFEDFDEPMSVNDITNAEDEMPDFDWLNSFDWKTDTVFVEDGGDGYFQLEYIVSTKKCLNFSVNGEA